MYLRRVALAFGAGLASLLLVGVAVTELAQPAIEFSLFLGIPVGVLAGVVVAAFVFGGLAPDAPSERRPPALALGYFGATLFVAFLFGSQVLGVRNTVALVGATILGLLAGVGAYVRQPDSGTETP